MKEMSLCEKRQRFEACRNGAIKIHKDLRKMGSRQFVKETCPCYEEKPHQGKSKTLLITVEQSVKQPHGDYMECRVRKEFLS